MTTKLTKRQRRALTARVRAFATLRSLPASAFDATERLALIASAQLPAEVLGPNSFVLQPDRPWSCDPGQRGMAHPFDSRPVA